MQMWLDQLMQSGWGDVTSNFHTRDIKDMMTELKIRVVMKPQTEQVAFASVPSTFGELMETLDNVRGKSQIP